jgi:hypothetical protein
MFEPIYLQQPIQVNLEWQLETNTTIGFVRMFIFLNYIHYKWKNCLTTCQFQFINKDRNDYIILEVIIDKCLWFCHIHFGLLGGNNDLNVLNRSQFMSNLLHGANVDLEFQVNGNCYPKYCFVGGIYPWWLVFVQIVHDFKMKNSMIGGSCKDVEHNFGVFQSRCAIVQDPCMQWN